MSETGSFSAPPQVHTFDGVLSDFDGTIVDSTDGVYISAYYKHAMALKANNDH